MRNLVVILLLLKSSSLVFAQTKVTQTREGSGFSAIELKMWAIVHVSQEDHYSVEVTAPQEWLDKIITEVEDDELSISVEDKEWEKDQWKNKPDIIVNISMPRINELNVAGSGTIKADNSILTDVLSLGLHGSGLIEVKDYKAGKSEQGVYGSGTINIGSAVSETIEQEIAGSGSIKSSSIMGSMITLQLAGSGDIEVSNVSAQKLEVSTQGSGSIKIGKGVTNDFALSASGSGSISASEVVGKNVSAAVAGSGSISVGVLDSLNASIAGSGSVMYKGNPANIYKYINGSGNVKPM